MEFAMWFIEMPVGGWEMVGECECGSAVERRFFLIRVFFLGKRMFGYGCLIVGKPEAESEGLSTIAERIERYEVLKGVSLR